MSTKFLVAVLALAVCAVACGPEPGPPPQPTPVPTPSATVGPEPTPLTPCKAVPPSPGVYRGDCEVTDECHDNNDGTYSGQCHTRPS